MSENKESWTKRNSAILGLTIPAIITALGFIGNSVLEGERQKGYNEAKYEVNEEYNEALRDAIVYRAKYESCCAAED